jgi:hypothetical protein
MIDEEQFEQTLRNVIIDLCEVLYCNGYRQAHVGAIMRLIGVSPDRAQIHDNEVFNLDEDFLEQLANRKIMNDSQVPPGTQLH